MAENSMYHTHISAKHRWMDLNLKEVWQYRDLIYLFTKRNFVVSYKQTILGPAWIFLTPLFTSIVQAFVFGGIAGIGTDGIPTFLFYLCSNAVWAYFANCLTSNANTFTANAYMFGKVYFPRLTTPISNVISTVIRFGIQMALVLVFMVYYLIQGVVHPHWLWWLMIPGGAGASGHSGHGLRHYHFQHDHKIPGSDGTGGFRRVTVDVRNACCVSPVHAGRGLDAHAAANQPRDRVRGADALRDSGAGNGELGLSISCHGV